MPLTPYTIIEHGRKVGKGRTEPITGTLDAILKADCNEDPFGIYNEYVALRLAQALTIPLATGALVKWVPRADVLNSL